MQTLPNDVSLGAQDPCASGESLKKTLLKKPQAAELNIFLSLSKVCGSNFGSRG